KNMIFDIGLGDTLSEREKKVYTTDGVSSMDAGLASTGLNADDIDYVILTHLHPDHAGGAVKQTDRGGFVPRFPYAKYIIRAQEWEVAVNPDERTSAVYIPERLHVLKESGQVEFIDGNTELFPGIRAVHTGGHTEGHFALEMESGGERVFYYADIFPTSHHMRVPFVPSTDLFPLDTRKIKRAKLPQILDGVVMAFDHDINLPLARVKTEGRRMMAEPVGERITS
ncbi:MAG: MBL fold metallo-hydrolase, partial [Chrysiogenales bacterium]